MQNAEIRFAFPLSKPYSIQAPRAGLEPAAAFLAERNSIQLSYRGNLSIDKETNTFDNISNNKNGVKEFTRTQKIKVKGV